MNERFTDRACKIIRLASEEARRCRRDYVSTCDVLTGLVTEGSGVGCHALKNLGVNLDKARAEIAARLPDGATVTPPGQKLPHSPDAKKVREYALDEARKLGHNYVGTEHLLLGLVRVENSDAFKVLRSLGASGDAVREEVLRLLEVRQEKEAAKEKEESVDELAMPLLRNVLVYVASPISKGDIVENVKRAHEAGVQLMKAGFSVIVPHGSCFWGNDVQDDKFVPHTLHSGTTHSAWLEMDLEIVRRCDAVLRLPGESVGADMEVAEARKHGIPVYHSVEQLCAFVMALMTWRKFTASPVHVWSTRVKTKGLDAETEAAG